MFEILDKIDKNLSNPQNLINFIAGLLFLICLYLKRAYSNTELLASCFKEEALPRMEEMMKLIILKIGILEPNSENLSNFETLYKFLIFFLSNNH